MTLIQNFENCLKSFCPHVLSFYGEALPQLKMQEYFNGLSIDISDYEEIYKWKNGIDVNVQDYSVDTNIDFAGNFISLKDAAELVIENEINGYWPNTLVPVLSNFEGENLLIETNKSSKNYKRLLFYSPSSSELNPIGYYDNIENMLSTIIELFESGAQSFNPDTKMLEIDFVKRQNICKRMNPDSERWY